MITCHCNYIAEAEIEDVVFGFLREDPWQLVVPRSTPKWESAGVAAAVFLRS